MYNACYTDLVGSINEREKMKQDLIKKTPKPQVLIAARVNKDDADKLKAHNVNISKLVREALTKAAGRL
jgi:post-segregation antitoxin (ccd killing protein)